MYYLLCDYDLVSVLYITPEVLAGHPGQVNCFHGVVEADLPLNLRQTTRQKDVTSHKARGIWGD